MKKIRISPSILEQYRLTCQGLYGKTGDSLAWEIIGPRATSDAMSRGTAYHRILEEGGEKFKVYADPEVIQITDEHDWQSIRNFLGYHVPEPELGKTWVFSQEAAQPALDIRAKFKSMVHELKHTTEMEVSGYNVQISKRYDGILGNEVHEFKTKSKAPTTLEYYDSLQWRCYLLGFKELTKVHYHVFQLNEANTKCTKHEYMFARDETVESFIRQNLMGFISWLETRPEVRDFLIEKANKPSYEQEF